MFHFLKKKKIQNTDALEQPHNCFYFFPISQWS